MIGSLAILGLISFYLHHIFKNPKLTLVSTAILFLLYGFIFMLLQLEDYALLLGSAGLLIVLGTVMYLTRKVDWYTAGKERKSNSF